MARFRLELQFDPPYDRIFEGILSFKRFSDAENTIRRIEGLRRRYLAAGDDKGLEYCRHVALAGRKRAELISRNPRISAAKRLHKKEIAVWFQIWLETPEMFESWLALRKKTEEYQGLVVSEGPAADIQERPPHGNEY